ncbi:glycosyltransferase family 39 protein [Streptomyces sp. 8L]|uniref:glycosyltransferase family 39 protein n=1 Tax=Streptomyces sp. 8L TaxID=2877242 RepID=UPI001CD25B9C|nr:glycosyltransferase family 39 protein [Streptomyces sp. 8L]MCA1223025.1 glycosyltransferase family 39 protein [Streptomyces sp. 8L]
MSTLSHTAATARATHAAPAGPRSWPGRLWRGRADDAPWVRPALLALLLLTAVLELWNLSASGYANSFYSAAVQAGSSSWKAFLFGSSDAGNSITVDKPPAALWPMDLSVRLFGLGSWQILVPQALMGTATVAVLYAAVRRRFDATAGLLAGVVLALTPVASMMFRFNNPDALLALLMTAAVYCVLRALEGARTKWLVGAGVLLGFAFLTKTLQAFLILPPLAVVYMVCAPAPLRRRLGGLLAAALAMVVAGGWWVALVQLWPASSRPYIGGSQNNSFLELTFGYNGFGRITGDETGSVGGPANVAGPEGGAGPGGGGGPGGGAGFGDGGTAGFGRMFGDALGAQISWLLPAALLMLVAALVVTRRATRTDTVRAAFLVWGGALLATMAVFSFMAGIFHQYYTVALAPYLAALVGMGASLLWRERGRPFAAGALCVSVLAASVWSFVLLGRTPDYLPWLRWAVLVGGVLAAAATPLSRRPRGGLAVMGLALAASLAGPFAYTMTTVATPHTGSIITAGPASAGGGFGGMRPPGGFGDRTGAPGGFTPPGGAQQGGGGNTPTGQGNGRKTAGGSGGGQNPPTGQGGGQPPAGTAQGSGQRPGGGQGTRAGGAFGEGGGRAGGGMGGLLDAQKVSSAVESALEKNASRYTWVAAAVGSQNAAGYQLATERPVMPIGGFNGSDPSPTLAQFKRYVADGRIHYLLSSGQGGGMGGPGGGGSSAITTWVEKNYTKVTVDGTTLYDLTKPKDT